MKKLFLLVLFLLTACAQASHLKFQTVSDLASVNDEDKTYVFHHGGYINDVRFEKTLEKILAKYGWRHAKNNKSAKYVVYFQFSWPVIVINSNLRTFGILDTHIKSSAEKGETVLLDTDVPLYTFFISIRENKKMTNERFGKEVFTAALRNNHTDLNRQTIEVFLEKILTKFLAYPDMIKYYTCEDSYTEADAGRSELTSVLFGYRINHTLVQCSEDKAVFTENVQTLDFDIKE